MKTLQWCQTVLFANGLGNLLNADRNTHQSCDSQDSAVKETSSVSTRSEQLDRIEAMSVTFSCVMSIVWALHRNATAKCCCCCWSGGRGILRKLSRCYSVVYCYNGAERYEQFLQVGRLYRALILLGLALYLLSTSVSSVFMVLYA